MNRVISVVGVGLLAAGTFGAFQTYSFQREAVEVQGQVVLVEELRGPPKPRQKTPLHVSYTLNGSQYSTVTHLPLLQVVKPGDTIRLLADPKNPEDARLPLLSELWARPLTYLIGGILMLVVARVLGNRTLR